MGPAPNADAGLDDVTLPPLPTAVPDAARVAVAYYADAAADMHAMQHMEALPDFAAALVAMRREEEEVVGGDAAEGEVDAHGAREVGEADPDVAEVVAAGRGGRRQRPCPPSTRAPEQGKGEGKQERERRERERESEGRRAQGERDGAGQWRSWSRGITERRGSRGDGKAGAGEQSRVAA